MQAKIVSVRFRAEHVRQLERCKELLKEMYPLMWESSPMSTSELVQMGIGTLCKDLEKEKAQKVLEEIAPSKEKGKKHAS